jgi:hypothetical protein
MNSEAILVKGECGKEVFCLPCMRYETSNAIEKKISYERDANKDI